MEEAFASKEYFQNNYFVNKIDNILKTVVDQWIHLKREAEII